MTDYPGRKYADDQMIFALSLEKICI